jgi:hypothetical protein
MFDVLLGLPRADVIGGEQWFDHQYSQINTGTFVGTNVDGGKNVRYPLLDLGYFNNTNSKIGYFDLRATFSLWTMCLAIAKKVNKTLTFNGGLPTRLFNTFITPKDWKYSDRIIAENKSSLEVEITTQTQTGALQAMFGGGNNIILTQNEINKIYDIEVEYVGGLFNRTNFKFVSDFVFNSVVEFAIQFDVRVQDLLWINSGSGIQYIEYLFEFQTPYLFADINPQINLVGNSNSGYSSVNPTGIAPNVSVSNTGFLLEFKLQIFANEAGFSPNGTTDAYASVNISFSSEETINASTIKTIAFIRRTARGIYPTGTLGQGNITATTIIKPHTEIPKLLSITHDERIYANGLISGTDLMGSIKPADVMKYAMRLTGSYLVETETTLTLVPFANYQSSTPTNWSGKANLVNGITVDYLNNNLGENNYLKYKEDDTNTPLDPYYLAGNLPTNIGTVDNILYESVFAQSAFNQTFTGAVSLVRVPYYDAPLAYYYRVWINDATAYTVGQFVGYLGRLFKVLANCLGSDGSPIVNTADYEEVDYSIFNDQSPTYRAIEVLTDQVTGVQVYGGTGTLLYTNSITAGLDGIDLQQSVNDTYGFIPSTFLDFRQIEVELMLTSIDIANLDLKKLVRIDELNGTFYVNALSNYTPDVSVPTKAILTLIP